MAKHVFIRMASAAGVLTLALFLLGLDPFLAFAPSAGAVFNGTPSQPVNRTLKGDRLPMPALAAFKAQDVVQDRVQDWQGQFNDEFKSLPPVQSASRSQIPVGCDPAFSPISSPRLAGVYRRCMT
jgi:hypothetical protein